MNKKQINLILCIVSLLIMTSSFAALTKYYCRICGVIEVSSSGATCPGCASNQHVHDWAPATCTKPKTCRGCSATSGNALGHSYGAATCTSPATCWRCGGVTGSALGHDYVTGTANLMGGVGEYVGGCSSTQHWGICSRCGDTSEKTSHSFYCYGEDRGTYHIKCCSWCGYEDLRDPHVGGTATCTTRKKCTKCDEYYGSTLGHNYSVWQHNESNHWKKCSRCSSTTAAESHSGGTHDNNGVCTSCTYQYQIHSKSGTRTGTPDATNHYYACSVSGCTFAYSEKHTGQTHANGGKCTTCSKVYVTHAITSTLVGTATETKHYFACVASGCTYQYEVAHVGATHANGGKCTDCGVVYQIHFPTTKITGTSTATNHWLACSFSGCTSAFTRNHEWTWSTTEHKKTCNIVGCGYFVTHTATWKYYNPAQHRCNSESCPLAQNHSWSYVQIAGNLEQHLLKCTCSNQEALLEPHIDADHNNICDKCKMQLWIMTYSPSTLTNQNVVATLNLWNKQTYTHTFVENGSYDIPLTDQDANQKITATVTWIDKSIIGRIEYSTTKPTKGTVTATILSDSEPITVTNNGGSNQYTFTENGIFTFEVKDARGNTASFVAKVSWIQKESASISTEYTSLKTGYVFGNITIKMNRKWKLPAGTTNNIDIKVVSENLTTRAQVEVPRSKIKISALNVKNADTGETYGDIESKEFEAGTYDLRFAIGGPNVFIDTKCKYIITLNSFNLLVSGNPTIIDTYDINKIEVYVQDLLDLT